MKDHWWSLMMKSIRSMKLLIKISIENIDHLSKVRRQSLVSTNVYLLLLFFSFVDHESNWSPSLFVRLLLDDSVAYVRVSKCLTMKISIHHYQFPIHCPFVELFDCTIEQLDKSSYYVEWRVHWWEILNAYSMNVSVHWEHLPNPIHWTLHFLHHHRHRLRLQLHSMNHPKHTQKKRETCSIIIFSHWLSWKDDKEWWSTMLDFTFRIYIFVLFQLIFRFINFFYSLNVRFELMLSNSFINSINLQ